MTDSDIVDFLSDNKSKAIYHKGDKLWEITSSFLLPDGTEWFVRSKGGDLRRLIISHMNVFQQDKSERGRSHE